MMYATDSRGPALVMRARNAVGAAFGALPVEVPDHPDLWLPGATFVTLHTAGLLHGCIGSLEATRSLAEDVQANAIAAAFHDPRFQPLTAREFSNTRFEVSVLGPASPVAAASEDEAIAALVPHRDGVTLSWPDGRATLLPQVWASLPDPKDFLRALKRKGGLPADFWGPDLRLERYTVMHFDETPEAVA
ncbi:MAG TPA: AmmeMemoRadiSam system protein A [Burkholderiaceae bacterium]|jgi:AmmeMemoRadiSam system protein A|nr:AmmeMemoRadiSam system protein A [Burkholderiaceae bacterium]